MGLFGKLFGNKDKNTENNSDNNRLIRLLDKWGREESEHSFKSLLHELFEGQSYLLVPTNDNEAGKWNASIGGIKLNLTSIRENEGEHILAVFSDETSLTDWTKEIVTYSTLKTQDVFELCRELEIDKVVINSGQKNTFTLERQKNDVDSEEENIEEEVKVRVGIPSSPLSVSITDKIIENAREVACIDEVYQFLKEDIDEHGASEFILMIGVRLSEDSDENREAMLNTIKQSLAKQKKPNLPLGIMSLDDKWLQTMETIANRPFYTRV